MIPGKNYPESENPQLLTHFGIPTFRPEFRAGREAEVVLGSESIRVSRPEMSGFPVTCPRHRVGKTQGPNMENRPFPGRPDFGPVPLFSALDSGQSGWKFENPDGSFRGPQPGDKTIFRKKRQFFECLLTKLISFVMKHL